MLVHSIQRYISKLRKFTLNGKWILPNLLVRLPSAVKFDRETKVPLSLYLKDFSGLFSNNAKYFLHKPLPFDVQLALLAEPIYHLIV